MTLYIKRGAFRGRLYLITSGSMKVKGPSGAVRVDAKTGSRWEGRLDCPNINEDPDAVQDCPSSPAIHIRANQGGLAKGAMTVVLEE